MHDRPHRHDVGNRRRKCHRGLEAVGVAGLHHQRTGFLRIAPRWDELLVQETPVPLGNDTTDDRRLQAEESALYDRLPAEGQRNRLTALRVSGWLLGVVR